MGMMRDRGLGNVWQAAGSPSVTSHAKLQLQLAKNLALCLKIS
jgi:hypothetical protein